MRDILKFVNPEKIRADEGKEFQESFGKLLKEKGIKFETRVPKYHHNYLGPLDNKVRFIEQLLFKFMYAQELNPEDAHDPSTIQVKFLQQVEDYYNNKVQPKLGMSPQKAFKLKVMKHKKL